MRLGLKLIKQEIQNVVVVFLVAVFFSAGCSLSVPEPDENNQTLLIIPVETNQTLDKFIFTANLTIQDHDSLTACDFDYWGIIKEIVTELWTESINQPWTLHDTLDIVLR